MSVESCLREVLIGSSSGLGSFDHSSCEPEETDLGCVVPEVITLRLAPRRRKKVGVTSQILILWIDKPPCRMRWAFKSAPHERHVLGAGCQVGWRCC